MVEAVTHRRGSDGVETAIRDLDNGHLHNAYRKDLARLGDNDPLVVALAAEITRRGHDLERAPTYRLERAAPAADGPVDFSDNKGVVDEREAFKERLEESEAAKKLLARRAALELRAAKLPKAEDLKSDADIATIDAWVRDAADLKRDLEAFHEATKAPWLMRGKVIDGFRREFADALDERTKGLTSRKRAYLVAKAERERAEREAVAAAERKAAAELRAQEQAALAAAEAARAEANAKAEALREAENNRAAAEAVALAQAAADEAPADTSLAEELAEVVDEAEEDFRASQGDVYAHQDAATLAGLAASNAENAAAEAEAAAASPHRLAKAGESGLKLVWKHRITSHREFSASLGPLEPFLKEADVDDALKRAAKAENRPTIPGVEFFEDYDVAMTPRRGR